MLDDRTALTRQEQRALAEIERYFRRDDPKLASLRLGADRRGSRPVGGGARSAAIVLIAVLAATLAAGCDAGGRRLRSCAAQRSDRR